MTTLDEALRALEKDLREEVALLRDMEGSCEHEQGIAMRAAAAMAESCAYKLAALLSSRQEVAPVAYFAADPANGEFDRYESLEEARERAEQFLDFADDDAADSGWADDPPQICYGVIVGHCVEESRKPAPTGSDFTEIVNFRLESSASTGQTSDAMDAVVTDAMVMAALDAQPLIDENESWRIWQIIGFDDARAKKIMRSALVAAMEASR